MSGRRPKRPTRRQLEVLGRIEEHVEEHGRTPTVRELELILRVGRGSVQRYLAALIHHGLLRRRGRGRLEVVCAGTERPSVATTPPRPIQP